MLVAYRVPGGKILIGSIELTDLDEVTGDSRNGSRLIEASMILPDIPAVRDTLSIVDQYGGSVDLETLITRTQSVLDGTYVPGGPGKPGYASLYTSSELQIALQTWSERTVDFLQVDGRYEAAYRDTVVSTDLQHQCRSATRWRRSTKTSQGRWRSRTFCPRSGTQTATRRSLWRMWR